MTADCVFCRICAGALPAHIVHETGRVVAFLDVRPIRPGHVQIVPREHHPHFDDLPPEIAAEIVQLGQRLAGAMKRIWPVRRVAFLFTGGDVPHAHAHVLPMVSPDDITSRRYIVETTITYRPMPRAAETELAETAARLRDGLDGR